MMQLLLPLGLLGLLGVLALILIYIIRPNYETRHINSTYIWKLSLKYKRKRLPTSKIRNLLIFLCQILILVSMAMILTKPAIVYEAVGDENELIAVIDSSMSMYTQADGGETRFSRAIDRAVSECGDVIDAGGRVSVIVADNDPSYLRQRISTAGRADLINALNDLKGDGSAAAMQCSYGASDLDKAMELCEEVLADNPYARIHVYTDKTYQYVPENITIVPIRDESEWNVGILDASAELDDGYYQLTVQLACYGITRDVELNMRVRGANAADSEDKGTEMPVITQQVLCDQGEVKTVIFRFGGGEDTQDIIYSDLGLDHRFYTFHSIELYVDEDDSLKLDNTFFIYGGLKEVVKVQYVSDRGVPGSSSSGGAVGANPFINGVLPVLKSLFASRWDIKPTEVKQGDPYATEGFDIYIFEHEMPLELPTDGAVFLLDPQSESIGADFSLQRDITLAENTFVHLAADAPDHPLMRNIIADNILVSRYWAIDHSNDYEVLMTCNGAPAFLVRNEENVKTAILTFSVHNSNLVVLPEWVMLMYNLFDYFLPSTVAKNAFEINEEITVNGRGPRVTFSAEETGAEPVEIEEFPTTFGLDRPGTYKFDVTTYFGKKAQTEYIFVRPPEEESNIESAEEALTDPFTQREAENTYDDLLVWFAAALVALLFIEWALHSREKS